MSDLVGICGSIVRGSTIRFATIFKDFDCQIVLPASATVHLVYVGLDGVPAQETISMSPPTGDSPRYTAQWDSRKASPGAVSWSIMSSGLPFAVEDGKFTLSANAANNAVTP